MSSTRQPNILVILTDQQRYDTISAGVNQFGVQTPALDMLASRGMMFRNAFCTSPICGPARATLMTGLYPTQVGIEGNISNPSQPMGYDKVTIGHRLQTLGYETVYHGKWHIGSNPAEHGFERVGENSHDASITTQAAQFYRNRDWITYKRPFFHVVSYLNPHDIYFLDPKGEETPSFDKWPNQHDTLEDKPWPQRVARPEPSWSDEQAEYYRRTYAGLVERVDKEIGELLYELRCSGFANNTWVIFTSDHGDMSMEHGLPFKGPYCYDGVLRVPLIITPPDRRVLGQEAADNRANVYEAAATDRLTSHIDLVPTIVDLAGGKLVDDLPGRSLVSTVQGDGADDEPDTVFAEWHQMGKVVTPIRTARTRQWKYNLYLNIGEELYDLANDPDELNNLANEPAHAGVRDALRKQVVNHVRETNDPFFSFTVTDETGKVCEPAAATDANGKSHAQAESQIIRQ